MSVIPRGAAAEPSRLRDLSWSAAAPQREISRRKKDELIRSSFFLVITTGTTGALGFAFWLINARIYNPGEVGEATSLLSATVLIAYLSLFGFNSSLIRFLPTSKSRDEEVTIGLIVVFVVALLLSGGYLCLVPVIAPRLHEITESVWRGSGFCVLTALSAVNLCTDSVFIALRSAKYNFYIDGLLQGTAKLFLPLLLADAGGFGIFSASGIAAALAVAASLLAMNRRLGLRPRVRSARRVVRRLARFSAANYLASLLNLVPILFLPTLVLDARGPATAGYFYVAFQIANLLNGGAYAVSESLFAEGSHADTSVGVLARRSVIVLATFMGPASILLAVAADRLLRVFGSSYPEEAGPCLAVLALAGIAVTLNSWTGSLLRVTGRLGALVWSNVVYAGAIVGFAALWAHRGLAWVAFAWLLGNVSSGACAGVILLRAPVHRRIPPGAGGPLPVGSAVDALSTDMTVPLPVGRLPPGVSRTSEPMAWEAPRPSDLPRPAPAGRHAHRENVRRRGARLREKGQDVGRHRAH